MADVARARLPDRRPSVTRRVEWQTEGGSHAFYITVGWHPETLAIKDVFYDDGLKSGTQLLATISDACVLISLALQYGATVGQLAHSMSSVPLWGGEAPGSPIGAILAEMMQEEMEMME